MSNIFYFGIPHVKNRTTGQQTSNWIPNAYNRLGIDIIQVEGEEVDSDVTGVIFDSTGRGIYSLTQTASFLRMIREKEVKNGDKIHYQDLWTPGIEALYYSAYLEKLDLYIYTTVWAQSVDEYDFTYPMRSWMRFFELGIDKGLKGIFVGNQKLKDLLVQSGFTSPIHVVGLPYNSQEVYNRVDHQKQNTSNAVIYTSRLDTEKNPLFMIQTAKEFLKRNPDWEWWVCSGLNGLRSNDGLALQSLYKIIETEPRFKFFGGLSKQEYYEKLNEAKIIFNCALQDWVSYTIIEATTLGCEIVYPNFRGFPEFVPTDRMYRAFNIDSALSVLNFAMANPRTHPDIPYLSDLGALLMAYIVNNGIDREVNIWLERYWVEELLKDFIHG